MLQQKHHPKLKSPMLGVDWWKKSFPFVSAPFGSAWVSAAKPLSNDRFCKLWMLFGLLVPIVSYLTAANRNLFFLLCFAALYGIFVCLVRTPLFLGAGSVAYALIVIWSVDLVPAPYTDVFEGGNTIPIESGDERWYVFQLWDLPRYIRDCGELRARLFIQGTNLDSLVVRLVGASITNVSVDPLWHLQTYKADLSSPTGDILTVQLRGTDSIRPRVGVGTEVRSFELYRDAVYLQFESGECRVVYHVKEGRLANEPAEMQ